MKKGPPFWKTSLSQLIDPALPLPRGRSPYAVCRSCSEPTRVASSKPPGELSLGERRLTARASPGQLFIAPAVIQRSIASSFWQHRAAAFCMRHEADVVRRLGAGGVAIGGVQPVEHDEQVALRRIAGDDELARRVDARHDIAAPGGPRGARRTCPATMSILPAAVELAVMTVPRAVHAGRRSCSRSTGSPSGSTASMHAGRVDTLQVPAARVAVVLVVVEVDPTPERQRASRTATARRAWRGNLAWRSSSTYDVIGSQTATSHFVARRGTPGSGTRSSNERTGRPARNWSGSVPRTNGIHTRLGADAGRDRRPTARRART